MLWNSQFFKSDIRFTQTKCAVKVAHDDRIKKKPGALTLHVYIYKCSVLKLEGNNYKVTVLLNCYYSSEWLCWFYSALKKKNSV